MAFSFSNLINKIKEQFTPQTLINIETGEVIKKRQLKNIPEAEKELYISSTKLPTGRTKAVELEHHAKQTGGASEVHRKVQGTKEVNDSGGSVSQIRQRKKKERKTKEQRKKEKQLKLKEKKERNKLKGSKNKTKDYMPPAPPKNLLPNLDINAETLPVINTVDELKKQLLELENKANPNINLSSIGQELYNIVEENEAYNEQEDGTNPYIDYLNENMEEISSLISSIEHYYYLHDDVPLTGQITTLANILNMGALSILQAEQLADYTHSIEWGNIRE